MALPGISVKLLYARPGFTWMADHVAAGKQSRYVTTLKVDYRLRDGEMSISFQAE